MWVHAQAKPIVGRRLFDRSGKTLEHQASLAKFRSFDEYGMDASALRILAGSSSSSAVIISIVRPDR
jgi:hypothetical protein